ncbi:MAG: type II secretion system protein [bacterium]
MADRRRTHRPGFTLLEAIVALAIIGLVCVGVLGAYATALRADVIAADRLPLSALAVERLAAVDLDAGTLDRLPDSLSHGAFEVPYAGATWDVETRRVEQHQGLFDVIVRVRDGSDLFTLRTRRYRTPSLALGVVP